MEKNQMKDKRKVLLVLPLVMLPFLALAFYAMGGGKGNAGQNQSYKQKGINTDLPNAAFKNDEPQNKMGFYQQSDRDSAGKDENGIRNLADRLGFNGEGDDPQTQQINQKLEALNKEISRPSETPTPVARNQRIVTDMGNDVDRLEALMNAMKENKSQDPEMAQLSGMLDQILDIQHPERVQARYQQKQSLSPDSLFRAIPAVLVDDQKVMQGSVIKLRLLDTVKLNGQVIPKNHLIYGTCNIANQRIILEIKTIRLGSSIIPVDLSVYSLDGMKGIDAPEAMMTDAVNSGADDAVRSLQLMTLDQSLATQVAGAGLDAAKELFSKKVKRIKVRLKAGQPLLLRNNMPNQLMH